MTLVTGLLGAGKSTAVDALLRHKPMGEVWAIFVNEFGQVGIDAAALAAEERERVVIKELAGGCMCCTAAGASQASIAQMVRRNKPDRLLVEMSGLGHPGVLLDALLKPPLGDSLEVVGTVCVLDPDFVFGNTEEDVVNAQLFVDQVSAADLVLANARTHEHTDALKRWHAQLWPPKGLAYTEQRGTRVPSTLLGRIAAEDKPTSALASRGAPADADHTSFEVGATEPAPGARPRVVVGRTVWDKDTTYAVGLIFHREDVFERSKVDALLRALHDARVLRAKAVVRTGATAWSVAAAGGSKDVVELSASAYRRDSRLEVLVRGTRDDRAGAPAPSTEEPPIDGDATAGALEMLASAPAPTRSPEEAGAAVLAHDWQALVECVRACVRHA